MAHYAKVSGSTVLDVIVADETYIQHNLLADGEDWVQTSYGSSGGIHYGPDGKPDGLPALRANYAAIGGTYDVVNDVFYNAQPYPSWHLSGAPAWQWEPPVPYPDAPGQYVWDEATLSWVLI